MKIISIDRVKCNGCGICQAICSINKKTEIKPEESRIRINKTNAVALQSPTYCQHCAEPVCVSACLKGIIDKDIVTGVVSRQHEKCFECAVCSVMCSNGAVVYDQDLKAYVTCDLCGGEPLCVKVCPTGALRFEDPETTSVNMRNKHGNRIFQQEGVQI